jgi:hypothetical protein
MKFKIGAKFEEKKFKIGTKIIEMRNGKFAQNFSNIFAANSIQ